MKNEEEWFHPVDTSADDNWVSTILGIIGQHADFGFNETDAANLLTQIKDVEHDEQRTWEWAFFYNGRQRRARVAIFKDDLTGADLSIETTDPVLAQKLEAYINTLLEEN